MNADIKNSFHRVNVDAKDIDKAKILLSRTVA